MKGRPTRRGLLPHRPYGPVAPLSVYFSFQLFSIRGIDAGLCSLILLFFMPRLLMVAPHYQF